MYPPSLASTFIMTEANHVELTPPNLIECILQAINMTECHAKATPTIMTPLGSNTDSPP